MLRICRGRTMADSRSALPEGAILVDKNGIRYKLAETLGRGGSGIVYSAYEENNGLEYAIKEFYPRCEGIVRGVGMDITAENPEAVDRLERFRALMERERQVGTMAAHRNGHALGLYKDLKITSIIIGDREYSSENFRFYLTLSYKGKFMSLAEAIENLEDSRATLGERLRLFKACVQAVDEIHLRDIVHRDLTPGNIAIFDNSAILLDFGLARWLGDSESKDNTFVLTTPGYCAPELMEGEASTLQVDVYSLGCILYTILYGRNSKLDAPDMLSDSCLMLMPGRAKAIGALEYVPGINDMLARATAMDPKDRYRDAAELMESLVALLEQVDNPEFASPVPGVTEIHNRDRELKELLKLVKTSGEATRIFVTGMSGIGKTTFVQLFGQRYQSGRVIYTTYNENLKKTIAGLRIPGEEPVKMDVASQVDKRFHSNLNILSHYTENDILIIDKYNIDDNLGLEQLLERDELFETLRNCGIKVILTTTCAYDENLLGGVSREYPLGELEEEELLAMLYSTRRGQFFLNTRDKAVELIERFCSNTLLVKLASAVFDNNRYQNTAEELYEDIMRAAEDRLGRIVKDGHINLTGISLDGMMEVMWNVTRFQEPERTKLLYLCTIPEEGLESELFDEMLRGYGVDDVELFLQLNWLEERAGRYYLHALVREIIRKKVYCESIRKKVYCESIAEEQGEGNGARAEGRSARAEGSGAQDEGIDAQAEGSRAQDEGIDAQAEGSRAQSAGGRLQTVEHFLEYIASHYHDNNLLTMFNAGIKVCPHKEYTSALYLEAIGEYRNAFWTYWEDFSDDSVITYEPEHVLRTIRHMADMAIASRNRELLTSCLNSYMGCMEITATKRAIFDSCDAELREMFKRAMKEAAEDMRAVYWECPQTRELKIGMNRTDLKDEIGRGDVNLTDSDYHPTPVTQYWMNGDFERHWKLAIFFVSKLERMDKEFEETPLVVKLRQAICDFEKELKENPWMAKYYSMVFASTRVKSQVLVKSLAGLLEDYLREAGKVLNDNDVNCETAQTKLRRMVVDLQDISRFGGLRSSFIEGIEELSKSVQATNDGRVNYVMEYYGKLKERCRQADFGIGNEEKPLGVTDMIRERVCYRFAQDRKLSGVAGVRRGRILVLIRKAMEYIFTFAWDPMQYKSKPYEERAVRSLELLGLRLSSPEETNLGIICQALDTVTPESGLWRLSLAPVGGETVGTGTVSAGTADTAGSEAAVAYMTGLFKYLFAEYDSPNVKSVLIQRIAGSKLLSVEERMRWMELLIAALDEVSYPNEVELRHLYAVLLAEQGMYREAIRQYEKIMSIRSPRSNRSMKAVCTRYAAALEAVGEHEKACAVQKMIQ